ncbi:MAG: ribonuclease PH, partial [Promethearchaeota archaeon]
DNVYLDLNYEEDSKVDVDFNIVQNEDQELLEIQGTAEGAPFNKENLNDIINLGEKGISELIKIQKNILNLH